MKWQYYLALGRFDRPIGIWLLLVPCLLGMGVGLHHTFLPSTTVLYFILLFTLGAVVMRAFGCAINDWVDRNIDKQVVRTAHRPLAQNLLTLREVMLFLLIMSIGGLIVLLLLPASIFLIALMIVPFICLYPFMKRFTWWPQLFLGIVFNWGVWLGGIAVTGQFLPSFLYLYLGAIFWTLYYDTIYAYQDIEDDALVSVKSTARLWGHHGKIALYIFALFTSILWGMAGKELALGPYYYGALSLVTLYFLWQIIRLDLQQPQQCFRAFVQQKWLGLILVLSLFLS